MASERGHTTTKGNSMKMPTAVSLAQGLPNDDPEAEATTLWKLEGLPDTALRALSVAQREQVVRAAVDHNYLRLATRVQGAKRKPRGSAVLVPMRLDGETIPGVYEYVSDSVHGCHARRMV